MKYLSIVLLCSSSYLCSMESNNSGKQLEDTITDHKALGEAILRRLDAMSDVNVISSEQVNKRAQDNQTATINRDASYKENTKANILADLNSHNFNKREKLAYIENKLNEALQDKEYYKDNQLHNDRKAQISSSGLGGQVFVGIADALGANLVFRANARIDILNELKKETQVLPRRRTNILGIQPLPNQSLIPAKKVLGISQSLPASVFSGQDKPMFDLDGGAKTLTTTIPVFVSNVTYDKPLDITLEPVSPEAQIILKQHEIIGEYINENKALMLNDRDALGDTADKATIDALDTKYAEIIVRLKYPDLNAADFYWAVLKEKAALREFLRKSIN